MTQILDVRTLEPKDRHKTIFDTFFGLNSGEAFILTNDHQPKPLLYNFQAEHLGQFDWWPLESGPDVWRVSIVKRETVDRDRSLTDYMQTDHYRLDKILETFQTAIQEGRFEEASCDFAEFNFGLRRHIQVEEELLFPIFEDKTGMKDAGPTLVMKMEHTEIKEIMDRLVKATAASDLASVNEATGALLSFLADHNMKEEHVLYPELDACTNEVERINAIKKAQTY